MNTNRNTKPGPWVTTSTRGRSTLDILDTEADVYVAYELEPEDAHALIERHNEVSSNADDDAAMLADRALTVKSELDKAIYTLRLVADVVDELDGDIRESLRAALGVYANH